MIPSETLRALALHGLSQAILAKALGVSQGRVSDWLRGSKPIPDTKAQAIADLWRDSGAPLVVSYSPRAQSSQAIPEALTWADLVEQWAPEEAARKDGWGYIGGRATSRKAPDLSSVWLICLDWDGLSPEALREAIEPLAEYAYLLHSTHSHTPEVGKYRLILPLSEPLLPASYVDAWLALNLTTGGYADQQTKNANRFYYLPSYPPGASPVYLPHDGKPYTPILSRPQTAERAYGTPQSISKALEIYPPLARKAMARAYLAAVPVAIEGEGGDARTLRAAMVGYDFGVDPEAFYPLLEAWNKKCQPPWSEDDLRAKLEGAYKYPIGDKPPFGWKLAETDPKDCQGSEVRERQLEEAQEAGGLILPSVNEYDLAQEYLAHVSVSGGRLAYDGRSRGWWQWSAETGLWGELAAEALMGRFAGRYHKALVLHEDTGKTSTLNLTARKTRDIYSALSHSADHIPTLKPRPGVVAFPNGVLDITSGKIRPPEPEDYLTSLCPTPLNPRADRRPWADFLRKVFPERDGPEKAAALAEFFGASLFGLATQYRKALVCLGKGRNGKSTLLETVCEALFTSDEVCSMQPQRLASRFGAINLLRKKINLVTETKGSEGERNLISGEVFKGLISGDPVTADRKGLSAVTFTPIAGHVLASNELPGSYDNTQAFWDRFLLVGFCQDFSHEGRTKEAVKEELLQHREAILLWALEGIGRLRERGWTIPRSHTELLGAWRVDTDTVAGFVASCTAPGGVTELRELYREFRWWTNNAGRGALSIQNFRRRLDQIPGLDKGPQGGYTLSVLPKEEWADYAG